MGVALIAIVAGAGAVAGRPYALPGLDTVESRPAVSVPVTPDEAITPGTATAWTIDSGASSIGFSGTHAGTAFKGRFERWEGQVWFDPRDLAGSKAVITVHTTSARTGDPTQEGSLQGAEWFDPAQYPTARFEATVFRALGGGRYEAAGTLRIKTTTIPVVLPFTFSESGGVATAEGRLELDRTAMNMGMASDAAADWVSKMIGVQIAVSARR